ncbi:MAG: VOC family protein [Dehalococcoidia bacterium]|jgi:predicted enzyme related to lactoylglutathione lyase|nr:VOC family protein [Dehalococcoidia bacterium]MDP6273731.1 VOC family protein [Dehalococcoidia bacterium]MDP7213946.1 VOC family protein [Dehalococcoidia bacterium]MDP7514414.1 VOC family protein [Dehalococcoidia bacterium]
MPEFHMNGIQHWMFPVADRMTAVPFYRDLLGLHLVPAFETSPGVTMMETDDGTMVHLSQRTERTPPTHVAFEVDDFDALRARLVELGHEIDGPVKRADGRPAMKTQDPSGNTVEFTTGPGPIQRDVVVDEWGRTTERPADGSAPDLSGINSEFHMNRVQHVMFPISDREDALPFYRDLLGLHIVPAFEDGPGVIFMETDDGTMFHMSEPGPAQPDAHIAFEVDDFDAVHTRLVGLGYDIQGPEKRGDGRPAMKISDPDGNSVEITTGPGPISIADRTVDEWGRTSIPGD